LIPVKVHDDGTMGSGGNEGRKLDYKKAKHEKAVEK